MALPERLRNKTVGQLRELARADAQEFASKFGPLTYPFDVTELARDAGAEVFIAQLGENVYGMIEGNESGATIYVDAESSSARRRFTIAHELGHMVSYKDEATMADFVDVRDDAGRGSAAEVYANEFAGELLMPRAIVKDLIERGHDNISIAETLRVSIQAVGYRRAVQGH